VVSVNLAVLNYFGMSNRIEWLVRLGPEALEAVGLDDLGQRFASALTEGENTRLYALLFWASSCVLLYFVIPALVVKLVFRQSLKDYGLGLSGAWKHIMVYVILFFIVVPAVIAVSFSERFQEQYPFYKSYIDGQLPPGFVIWELAYAMQFFALEFFFRGFLLHGLKHRMGFYAVFAMIIPYCMIHFGKPFPETLAAIIAGFVLGVLSLRTKTIWLGFLIHVSVAWSMDLTALIQTGVLF
jgi:uncharacterized protein